MYKPSCLLGHPIAQRLLWLLLASVLLSGNAVASPVVAVSPDSLGPIELPGDQLVRLHLRIYDLDSQGSTPLTWTISDVVHGTDNDVPWVRESPTSGTIAPAGSEDVSVTLDTSGMAGGPFFVDLRIDTNDPLRPRVIFPMKFWLVVPVSVGRITFGELKARYR